uniref:uncharacterized protein LOC122586474 n=1 Tax=Erigeron canadensis TaxID=72917 RepID=UPI001CB9CC49|nr:uncharacterized protein LOC122586474 [Erigeron canadensis]
MGRIERNSWERFLRSRHGILGSRDQVSRLPESVLQHVISFVPSSDQRQIRLLSRKWRRLSAQNEKMLYLYGCRLNEQELLRVLEDDFHSAEFLVLKKCPGMRKLELVNFKLRTIELNYCGSLKNVDLNTPFLETFYFYGPRVRPCVIEFGVSTQLRTLHLVGVAINNMMFKDCNKSFPVLQVLTLSGCDIKSCINISSNSLRTLRLLNFKNFVEITIDTANLLSFMYTGSTIVLFVSMNCPSLILALIELNSNRYQSRDEMWFRRLNQMLQGLKHTKKLTFDTNSDKNFILPKHLRESLVPPLDLIPNKIYVRRSRSMDVVEFADAMLWMCPRVKKLKLSNYGLLLRLVHRELLGNQEISCCFCSSQPLKCWRHSVTEFELQEEQDHNKEAGKKLMSYLRENLQEAGNKAIGMLTLKLH